MEKDKCHSFNIPITDPGNTLRFLLVGKTGCGKSSTGNTILGRRVFYVHPGFYSHKRVSMQTGQVFETKVEIMDTPGLFNTAMDLEDDAKQLVHAVQSWTPGPHVVLFVIHAERFTKEAYNAYKCLQELFDPQISEHMIIIFTGGDLLERDEVHITQLLAGAPKELSEVLREREHRYLVFDNTCPQQPTQVDELLQMSERLVKSPQRQHFLSPYNQLSPVSQDGVVMARLRSFYISELRAEEDFPLILKERHGMDRKAKKRTGILPVRVCVCSNCEDFMQAVLELIVYHVFYFVFRKMSAAWTNEN